MKSAHQLIAAAGLAGVLALGACNQETETAAPAEGQQVGAEAGASSDSGQVVATVAGEDITVHQLNHELAGIPAREGQDPQEIREAVLRAMVFRTAMRQIALKDGLDRAPEASMTLDVARDRVLADLYLRAQTGTMPPPTDQEVREFIVQFPLQFDDRRIYEFTRITFPSDAYSDVLVPLFDETETFDELEAYFKAKGANYSINKISLPSGDFPKPVQDQLQKFGVGDNVVAKTDQQIAVLKIEGWTDAPLPTEDAERIARNALMQQSLQERARAVRDVLANDVKIEFKGAFADMALVEKEPSAPAPAAPGNETEAPGMVPAEEAGPASTNENDSSAPMPAEGEATPDGGE